MRGGQKEAWRVEEEGKSNRGHKSDESRIITIHTSCSWVRYRRRELSLPATRWVRNIKGVFGRREEMIKESTLKRIFVVRKGVRYGILLSRGGFAGKELHLNSSWTLLVLTSLVDEALLIESKSK